MSDPKGERGGDTGKTDQKGKGPQAEKGDQRRRQDQPHGETRGHNTGKDRPGSKSNAEHKE